MSAKHTPGPWEVIALPVGPRGGGGGIIVISKQTPNPIVHMPSGGRHEANARLIAAAPEMYALLRRCETLIDKEFRDSRPHGEEIRALLAKIDGAA